jgi:glucose-6-phosphate 1-epimerase
MRYVEVRHPSGARLTIYLHGAHLTSWRNSAGQELLFMSRKSWFEQNKPIRGGIPVVFPQFGDGPLPKHGFARIQEWKFAGARCSESGNIEAEMTLAQNSQTMDFWPFKFKLRMVFRLWPETLEILFAVHNTGNRPFAFKNGLHTYLSVHDIKQTFIEGLHGKRYMEYIGKPLFARERRRRINFRRETDRVYPMAPDTLILNDDGHKRKIVIEKNGMRDVVIWNPWIEKSRRMEDFGDQEYRKMVCVETGNLHQPVKILPGAVHHSFTRFLTL